MKNQFKNFSKLGYIGMIALLFAFVMVACKQDQDVMPEDTGKIRPTFGNKSAATCDFDANRFMRLSHLHQKARVTTQGITNFANQLYEAADGAAVNVGPLRFTAPGGEVEVGGGEGYGVTSPSDGGNNSKKKSINPGETLIIQTRSTSDEILKATISFKFAGGDNDFATIKASKGNRCVGEQTFDLTDAEFKTVEVCFGQSFTKLEVTVDANSDGVTIISKNEKVNDVWVNFPTIFYVGTQTFIYDFLSSPINFEQGALDRANLNFPGSDATTTSIGWHIEYRNDDCDGTGSVYRYYLRRQDTGELLAGVAGNNQLREPNRIFGWQRNTDDWNLTTPFALLRKYHARNFRPAIATPNFTFGYPNRMNQATFQTPTNGIVTFTDAEGTNWEARQGDLNGGNLARVYVYKNGVQWARTNGDGENGSLQGFAVLPVRKSIIDSAGKISNIYEYVGFTLVLHRQQANSPKGLMLQTKTGSGFIMQPIQQNLEF